MRYAIFSDVHSNLEALTAVFDHAASQRVDRYLCLGDLIGYGADPEACLERLQACEAVSVTGNHEWACIGKLDPNWFNETARRVVVWTRDRLGFRELDFLRRLPLIATEGPVTLVHGTLTRPERFEYLVDLAQAVDTAKACRTLCCATGHTHIPTFIEYDLREGRMARVLTAPQDLTEVPLTDDPAHLRYVLNPGSVGQPRDGDPRASYAILDAGTQRFSVHRVDYDIPTAQRKIREAGLPALLADRLAVGR